MATVPPKTGNRNLMANIQKQLEAPSAQNLGAGQMTDQTERSQGLLRAKLGKADSGTGAPSPRISSMAERQQVSQGAQAAKQQQLQGALAGQELEQAQVGLEAKEAEQKANILERQADLQSQFARQEAELYGELERGTKDIKSRENVAKLEQLGFNVRLQNKDYITNLQRAGEQARLNDKLGFKEELARQSFADDQMLSKLGVDYKKIADMDDRSFKQELAQMDMQYAQEMAHNAKMEEASKAKWGMFGSLVQGGTTAYGSGMFSKGKDGAPNPE